MNKGIIFGGTTEGRRLCEFCRTNNISVLYCVATEDGARPVESLPNVETHIGRLNADTMLELFEQRKPGLVIDATHPYAAEASKNIKDACGRADIRLIRITRESGELRDCLFFNDMTGLLVWLETQPGNIFVTTGASTAAAFTNLTDYQSRVWLRVLPSINSLSICLEAGYHPERLICMQGPFSMTLNRAMFAEADARILVTKDSGTAGGFPEKIQAAQSLGMTAAVITRPEDINGFSFEEACKVILREFDEVESAVKPPKLRSNFHVMSIDLR